MHIDRSIDDMIKRKIEKNIYICIKHEYYIYTLKEHNQQKNTRN
jgi:hypothetical protein